MAVKIAKQVEGVNCDPIFVDQLTDLVLGLRIQFQNVLDF